MTAREPWPAETKALAIEMWQAEGMAAAHEATGVPKGTITHWVAAAGLSGQSKGSERTVAATEQRLANQHAKRVELQTLLLDKAIDMLKRMDKPSIDFKGRDAVEVSYPTAPSGACQQYATAAAICLDKFRLEVGEVTDRHGIDNPAGFVGGARSRLRSLPGGAGRRTG